MIDVLLKYREAKRLSALQLSARLGVNKTTLWRWEKGRIPASRIVEIELVTRIPRKKLRPDLYL